MKLNILRKIDKEIIKEKPQYNSITGHFYIYYITANGKPGISDGIGADGNILIADNIGADGNVYVKETGADGNPLINDAETIEYYFIEGHNELKKEEALSMIEDYREQERQRVAEELEY